MRFLTLSIYLLCLYTQPLRGFPVNRACPRQLRAQNSLQNSCVTIPSGPARAETAAQSERFGKGEPINNLQGGCCGPRAFPVAVSQEPVHG